jgi:hypothetical protein
MNLTVKKSSKQEACIHRYTRFPPQNRTPGFQIRNKERQQLARLRAPQVSQPHKKTVKESKDSKVHNYRPKRSDQTGKIRKIEQREERREREREIYYRTLVLVSQRTSRDCTRRDSLPAIHSPRNGFRQCNPGCATCENRPHFSTIPTVDCSTQAKNPKLAISSVSLSLSFSVCFLLCKSFSVDLKIRELEL